MTSALSCGAKGQILWLGFGGMWGGTECLRALWLELGGCSGVSDRNAYLGAHSEPLSFANLASSHPHVDGHQTLDHVGTALTQQFRSVLIALAEVAVHVGCSRSQGRLLAGARAF